MVSRRCHFGHFSDGTTRHCVITARHSRDPQQPDLSTTPTLIRGPLDHFGEIARRLIAHRIQEPYAGSDPSLVHPDHDVPLSYPVVRVRGLPGGKGGFLFIRDL